MSLLDIRVPGDKSIAHRAVFLAALAQGQSSVRGVSEALDVRSSIDALRALGADIRRQGDRVTIHAVGAAGLRGSTTPVDCGNSGTTARFLMGVAAALPASTVLTGDASLTRRPMERVAAPLRRAGAIVHYLDRPDRLPVRVQGARLGPIAHRSGVASAQVKSALLLAGVAGGVDVSVEEPVLSRDHTERLLRAMGAQVTSFSRDGHEVARLVAPARLDPVDVEVPGDFSSAAFMIGAALVADGPQVRLAGVGVNPTRTGFLDVLARMGADVTVEEPHLVGCEPVASVLARPARLRATTVGGEEAVRLVDELPLLAALAAHADGETTVTGAAELRAKESDRISALCTNLRALGVDVEERADGFVVRGGDGPLSGHVRSFGDHRIAMAFAILGLKPGSRIRIDDLDVAAVSFPGFAAELERIRGSRRSLIAGEGA